MSTNPFEDSPPVATTTKASSSLLVSPNTGGNRRKMATRHQYHHHHQFHHQQHSNKPSSSSKHHHSGGGTTAGGAEPAIWAARNVEWPIPSALSLANYQKLVKTSKLLGQQLGITVSAKNADAILSAPANDLADKKEESGSNATSAAAAAAGGTLPGSQSQQQKQQDSSSNNAANNSYFTGFMSRVLNTSAASEKSEDDLDGGSDHHHGHHHAMDRKGGEARPLRPPRQGCVSAANGWIVAALECPALGLGGIGAAAGGGADDGGSGGIDAGGGPVLRLVSRWNVRRGGMADQWMSLPPPVSGDGRILHVFCDPTANHTFVSAANGEAYYIHSSQKQAIKLAGFGPTADGKKSKASSSKSKDAVNLTGVPATAVAHRRDEASQAAVQAGLSTGSYVTAIAWDKERGTEGSSKKILLGTSAGEIYEYNLVSPASVEFDQQEDSKAQVAPVLLHKLYYADKGDVSEVGAAVSGLYFERLRTGLLVLAATSGRHKRTRFYTFYSAHSSSFRMVMADQQHSSLTELPGSVDFADLRLCNDHFGLRTATGIYYGTIDRSLSGPAVLSGRSNMIVDPGMLPFDGGGGGSDQIPVSLALTPHHLITLSDSNEIRFINRVAQKTIQKERVDGSTPTSNLDESQLGVGELMMDIRRPDQVWLRKARSLVHISSTQEDRDVWKFTLQKCLDLPVKGRGHETAPDQFSANRLLPGTAPPLTKEEKAQEDLFEEAKSQCINGAQKAVVTGIRAEYHLSQGRAELAAKYLAQCPAVLEPFADTSIRLALPKLGIDDPQSYGDSWQAQNSLASSNIPLITYLSDKMRTSKINDDRMTCTMIGAWLTELYLHERSEQLSASSLDANKGSREVETSQRALLAKFLNSNVNNMDAKTIMKILTSHDVGAPECSIYAAKSGDIATAVNAALSVGSKDTVSLKP